jgi:general secretion pathway protein F
MPIFKYRGYKQDGSEAAGTVEADGLKDALAKVRESGFFPKEVSESVLFQKKFFHRKTDASMLPAITRQLSLLLSSGVPLMEALRSLSEENHGDWKGILINVRERVSGGASLARSLEEHQNVFPEFYRNMVAAGEMSGTLDRVLIKLADFLESRAAIRAKVAMATIYPFFIVCVGVIVLSFLFVFVIPKIVKIFEDTKNALPFITVVLIQISNLFRFYWWVLLGLIIAFALVIQKLLKERRILFDRLLMKAPGNIVQTLYFARFSRTLGFLLDGGLPILGALDLAARSVGNRVLEDRVMEASKLVAEGGRLSASLSGFPPVLLQLISTGEKGGMLPEVLNRAADSYEEEFGRRVQKALAFLEPLMILIMGLIVGFIVLAVLLPMFQLNQLVR